MVVKRCCAYGCKAKSGGGPKFVSFPSCRQRCRDWLKALNRPDILADISGDKYSLLNFYYVCDAHFTKNKDIPALYVASKGTSTNKTTNMEDTGTCTDETNMEETGTNTEKTNMNNKATCTKKTKMKDTSTSTEDLGIGRLSISPVDIIDIQPLPSVVIPVSIVHTQPTSPKPLVPVTNAVSPGFISAEANDTILPSYVPGNPTAPSPKHQAVPVDKPAGPEFLTAALNVTRILANFPEKLRTTSPKSLAVPVDKPTSPGCITAEPDVTQLSGKRTTNRPKSLVIYAPLPEGIMVEPNVTKVIPDSDVGVEIKNPVKTYTRIRSATEKVVSTKTSRPEQTAADDIWKNSLKAYDARIRPATTKGVPSNTPRPEHMVANDIWKNSVNSYDTRSRPPATTKDGPSNTPYPGYMVADDIRKNSSLIHPKESPYFPSNTTCTEHMPVPDDILKNPVHQSTQTPATTSSLRNYRKNIVPAIAVQKLHTDHNVTTEAQETNETGNTSETREIKMEIKSEDTEITIEEHPLFNATSERDRIRTPEIKTEPDNNEIDTDILEENALGLDDVFKALSERESNSQRLDASVNIPNLTFKLQMNLPVLEQALTAGPNLRRELKVKDIDKNIRTYKRKKKD